MNQLRKEFNGVGEVKGYFFRQIYFIKGVVYIYEVSNDTGTHYEVFKHKENKRFNCISYPKSSSFGVWAWTCGSLNQAHGRVQLIILDK